MTRSTTTPACHVQADRSARLLQVIMELATRQMGRVPECLCELPAQAHHLTRNLVQPLAVTRQAAWARFTGPESLS